MTTATETRYIYRARYMTTGGDWTGWFWISGTSAEETKARICASETCHRSGMADVEQSNVGPLKP
jgi:hypothetical protein